MERKSSPVAQLNFCFYLCTAKVLSGALQAGRLRVQRNTSLLSFLRVRQKK